MRQTMELFNKLENCTNCKSNIDCPLSTIKTLPRKVLQLLVCDTTKEEIDRFHKLIRQCPESEKK